MSQLLVLECPRADALPKRMAVQRRAVAAASEQRSPRERGEGKPPRASSGPGAQGIPKVLSGLRVVIVDDDPDSLDYFGMALRSAGAAVTAASNATDALRMIQDQRPDVVLSDIAMVEKDGYWLAREVRGHAEQTVRRLPLIATTAYGREHSRERTLAAGFNDHLPKPVLPEVLWRAIAAASGR